MARKNKSCGHHFAKLWWDLSGLTVGFIVISTYTYIDIYIYVYIYNSPALFVGRCSPNGPVKWCFFYVFLQMLPNFDVKWCLWTSKVIKKKRDFHKMSANRPDISQPFFLIPFRRPESRGHHLGRDLGMSSQAWQDPTENRWFSEPRGPKRKICDLYRG